MPEWVLAWLIVFGVFVGLPCAMYFFAFGPPGRSIDRRVCEVALERRLTEDEYEEIRITSS